MGRENDQSKENEVELIENLCRVEYRDAKIAFSYDGPGEIIAAAIKLIFALKVFRRYFLMACRCAMDNCKNIPCTLKKIFHVACVKGKVNSNISLAPFISAFENEYKGECSYDNIFDCFLIYMHSFDRAECMSYKYNASPFFWEISQDFECKCGRSFSKNLDMSSYLTVNIKDSLEFIKSKLCFVLSDQLNNREFNLCEDPKCRIRKCQRKLNLNKESQYILIKLNWISDAQGEIVHRSLQQAIKPSDIFKTAFQSNYRLCIIATDDIVFHFDLDNWMHDISTVGTFDELLAYLASTGKKINFIVYEKSEEMLINRSNSQLRNSKSPSNLAKYTVAYKAQVLKCEKCFKFSDKCVCKENGKALTKKCYKCDEIMSEEMLYAHICKPAKEIYFESRTANSFTQQYCINCQGPSTNSSLCSKCSLGGQFSSSLNLKPAARAPPKQLNCKICRSKIQTGICMACLFETSTELCKNCKKTTIIQCKKCYDNSRTPKRAASSIRRKVCEVCKNGVSPNEEKNCINCYKKFAGVTCMKCKTKPTSRYLCDYCMRNHKK